MTKSAYKTQKKNDPAIKVFLLILLNITLFYFDQIKEDLILLDDPYLFLSDHF